MKPTPEQAKKLFDKGMISAEQFNRLKAVPGYDDNPTPVGDDSDAGDAQATQQTVTSDANAVAPDNAPPAAFVPIVPPVADNTPYSVGPGVFSMPTQNVSAPAQDNTLSPIPNAEVATNPNLKLASDVQITRPGDNGSIPFGGGIPQGQGTPLSIYNAQNKQIEDLRKGGGGGLAAAGQKTAGVYNELDASQQASNAQRNPQRDAEIAQLQDYKDKMDVDAKNIANAKVDTNRYWDNMSTGGKITAGLGLLLGSFGSGTNGAVDVITNAIKQDIDAQKTNFENMKEGYQAKKGIFADMMSIFKDKDLAQLAAQAQYQQHAQNQVAAIQAQYAGSGEGAKMQQAADALAVQQQETAMGFNQRAQQLSALTAASNGTGNINPLLLDKDTAAKFVPGYGITYSADDAKNMKEILGEAGAAQESIKTLKKFAGYGAKLSPEDAAQAQAATQSLIGSARRVLYGGKANAMELEALNNLVQNPTDIGALPMKTIARLNGLNDEFNSKIAAQAKAIGLQTPQQKAGIQPLQGATATKP